MSGGYKFGNYEIFVPQGAKGKYNKYANQLVVIVSITRDKKDNIKAAKIYFTDEVEKTMGAPNFVKLGTSGSNVGIIPLEESDGECYVVTRRKEKEDKDHVGMSFININAFAKYLDLGGGVYNAHKEPGGVIEFNYRSKPSRA